MDYFLYLNFFSSKLEYILRKYGRIHLLHVSFWVCSPRLLVQLMERNGHFMGMLRQFASSCLLEGEVNWTPKVRAFLNQLQKEPGMTCSNTAISARVIDIWSKEFQLLYKHSSCRTPTQYLCTCVGFSSYTVSCDARCVFSYSHLLRTACWVSVTRDFQVLLDSITSL